MKLGHSDNQFILALYGGKTSAAYQNETILRFMEWAKSLAQQVGKPFTDFDCRFSSQYPGLTDKKCYSLKKKQGDLDAAIAEGNVCALSLHSLPTENSSPAFDWQLTGYLGQDKSGLGALWFGFDMTILKEFDIKRIRELIEEALKVKNGLFDVAYGFGVIMPKSFCPSGYATGLVAEAPEELVYDANYWRRKIRKNCDELFRNVYGINILNSKHLSIKIGELPLTDWIDGSIEHGGLTALSKGLYLWSFEGLQEYPDFLLWDTGAVSRVRNVFKEHGLFAWQEAFNV